MTDKRKSAPPSKPSPPSSDVLGGLPRSRPHRRSQKRPAAANAGSSPAESTVTELRSSGQRTQARSRPSARAKKPASPRLRQPAQPGGLPPSSRPRKPPPPPTGTEIIEITVRAAAELAEIGFVASTQALRNVVSRLPRP